MNIIQMLFLLLAAHAVADYPLQGDFLAKAKNRFAPVPGVPWYQAMGAHTLIHGGFVALITGSVTLGLLEVIAHGLIDDAKCQGKLTFNQDQLAHVLCKVIWVMLAFLFLPNL